MKLPRILHSSALYLAGNLASRAAGFLMIPLYTRFLSTSDYGLIEILDLTMQTLAIGLGLFSVGEAMIRIYQDPADQHERNQVVSTAVCGATVLGSAITAAGMIAAPWIGKLLFQTAAYNSLIRLFFIGLWFGSVTEILLVYERILDRARQYVFFSLLMLVSNLALNVYFIAGLKMGVWGFAYAKLITTSAGYLFLLVRALREVGFHWRSDFALRMFRFGAPVVVTNLAFFSIHFSNRYFLNAYAGLSEVGLFSLGFRMAFVLSLLVTDPFMKTWNVALYGLLSRSAWREDFARAVRYFVFALALVGLGISLFADEVLEILATPAYFGAGMVVPLIVAAYLCRDTSEFYMRIFYMQKETLSMAKLAVSAAAWNALLNLLLVPHFGGMGAAWASVFTWAPYLAWCWSRSHRLAPLPYLPKSFLMLVGLVVAIWTAGALAQGPLLLRALWQSFLLLVFLAAAWLAGYIQPEEKRLMSDAVRTVCGRVSRSWIEFRKE